MMMNRPTLWMTLDSVRSCCERTADGSPWLLLRLLRCRAADLQQPRQDKRDNQDGNDSRHLVAHEVEGVIAPTVEHLEEVVSGAIRPNHHSLQAM
jgi:hypothetical protein